MQEFLVVLMEVCTRECFLVVCLLLSLLCCYILATVAQAAAADNVSIFKFARWRRQGVVLDEVLSQYKSVGAELNVLPYCTQFIPMEVITEPCHQSICYHPSLLPLHRGASSINWSATLASSALIS